jgi:hypothetical protein
VIGVRTRRWVAAIVVLAVSSACDRPTSAPTPSAPPSVTTASVSASASASASASTTATNGAQNGVTKITFDADPIGAPPPEFEAVVGAWSVVAENGVTALKVDGSKWSTGQPSASLADQAKKLLGDQSAAFVDGVKSFAFFPFAVWDQDPIAIPGSGPRVGVRISVRFYPEAGTIDQGAGILFDVAPDGSYWGVRANALEGNLLFFHVVKGHRTVLEDVRNVPTPSRTWHTLGVEIRGTKLTVTLDDQKRLERTLDAAPTGRLGLWSKADSQILFDDFTVTPL